MSDNKHSDEKQNMTESIYMSGHGLDWEDSYHIAEQLYNEGYSKKECHPLKDINLLLENIKLQSRISELENICRLLEEDKKGWRKAYFDVKRRLNETKGVET